MTKWEVARYLIDAKKCVDSIWYIAENRKQIRNIDLRRKVSQILREFYISCCVVLDELRTNKRELCQANPIIEKIYYERDKDKAHKDADYKPAEFSTLFELRDIMKDQLLTVFNNCRSVLPDNITLNYVPHDKELFRLLHSITADKEEEIKKRKYPLYNMPSPDPNDPQVEIKTIFYDTEDLRRIPDGKRNQYAVIIEDGINIFEGLQERQDGFIRLNVLYGEKTWCTISEENVNRLIRWTKLGLMDIFSMPQMPDPNNPEAMEEFYRISRGEIDFGI